MEDKKSSLWVAWPKVVPASSNFVFSPPFPDPFSEFSSHICRWISGKRRFFSIENLHSRRKRGWGLEQLSLRNAIKVGMWLWVKSAAGEACFFSQRSKTPQAGISAEAGRPEAVAMSFSYALVGGPVLHN